MKVSNRSSRSGLRGSPCNPKNSEMGWHTGVLFGRCSCIQLCTDVNSAGSACLKLLHGVGAYSICVGPRAYGYGKDPRQR